MDELQNNFIARDPEEREGQLVHLAVDLAEKQLREGTASSQVIVHYLKMGSMKERIERENLKRQNELLVAKVEALQAAKSSEETAREAIEAFKRYKNGSDDTED